jgi:hypothetical protein
MTLEQWQALNGGNADSDNDELNEELQLLQFLGPKQKQTP